MLVGGAKKSGKVSPVKFNGVRKRGAQRMLAGGACGPRLA
jgi:hypothetical protein